MTSALHSASHRRVHGVRKPLVAGLAATAACGPAASAASGALSAKFPCRPTGCTNVREWPPTATATTPSGTLPWASVPVTSSYATALTGASPTTATLKNTRLTP
ncbi:hypothetical protein DI272_10900 [Streptomyces sp. Act143]|uniref:hypothetical protein n=1 Tax=Streptomyces sp. Act143 TaxID=2200760 RepID=UPI000D683B5E|nr:hypothetical protein [Streptomyces sp. Act143]PWI14611.1 hypothetical protein DI272_10900 [Streptomyces sp. Act143]